MRIDLNISPKQKDGSLYAEHTYVSPILEHYGDLMLYPRS